MVKITLTMEGNAEEIGEMIDLLQAKYPNLLKIDIRDTSINNNEWTEKDIRTIWHNLTGDCKHALREILDKDMEASLTSLNEQIEVNKCQNLPAPVTKTENGYRLDPIWNQTIIKINDEADKALDGLEF